MVTPLIKRGVFAGNKYRRQNMGWDKSQCNNLKRGETDGYPKVMIVVS